MNVCAKNKKALSWLAINALEPREAQVLRAHLETCPGCRGYLESISRVVDKLQASSTDSAATDLSASEMFHRQLARRIDADNHAGVLGSVRVFLRGAGLNWRIAMPFAAAAMLVIALLAVSEFRQAHQRIVRVAQPVAVVATASGEMTQTLGNYRMLANRSPDLLDQELYSEAAASGGGVPIYKASSRSVNIAAD